MLITITHPTPVHAAWALIHFNSFDHIHGIFLGKVNQLPLVQRGEHWVDAF
jgi:hypothetical protein